MMRNVILIACAVIVAGCSMSEPETAAVGQHGEGAFYMSTDAELYTADTLQQKHIAISFSMENETGQAVLISGPSGHTSHDLYKQIGQDWVLILETAQTAILGVPLELPAGESYTKTFNLDFPSKHVDWGIEDVNGIYRLQSEVYWSYDLDRLSGESLPLDMRVSNPFEIRIE